MVVKIMPSAADVFSVVGYNEKKVEQGAAKVCCICGTEYETTESFHEALERLDKANIRTRKPSFHMAINPGPEDNMDEEQVKAFAKELMERLGYGNQPYALYQHYDTDRIHYHIVSFRTDREGKKIDDRFEKKRCHQIMKELSEKYGYKVETGLREVMKTDIWFDPKKGNVKAQIQSVFDYVNSFQFGTEDQFINLMKSLGVDVVISSSWRGKMNLTFYGLDWNGERCTSAVRGSKIQGASYDEVFARTETKDRNLARQTAQDVERTLKSLLPYAQSERQLYYMLKKRGILMFTEKNGYGGIYDVSFADLKSRCCIWGKEHTSENLAELLEKTRQEKGWKPEPEKQYVSQSRSSVGSVLGLAGSALKEGNRKNEDNEYDRRFRKLLEEEEKGLSMKV